MRRLLWLGVGVVLGATAVPLVTRRIRRTVPVRMVRRAGRSVRAAGGSFRAVRGSVRRFAADVRDGMREREAQLLAARDGAA